ncbi:MAG: hypothetical protein V9H69_24320 [Anaerolineae bacterium]
MSYPIQRFSSRRQPLDGAFLADRLQDALSYDRIAGYFSSFTGRGARQIWVEGETGEG